MENFSSDFKKGVAITLGVVLVILLVGLLVGRR